MKLNTVKILSIVPPYPSSKTTKQVHEQWGEPISLRTVQRNLKAMEDLNLIRSSKDGKIQSWFNPNKGTAISPSMSSQNAFAIKTSEPFLQEIIPSSLKNQFDVLFKEAANVLNNQKDKTPWQEKFVLEAPTFPPSHEQIDPFIKEDILKAVLEEESIQILYQRPDRTPNWRIVFPYGVILSKNTQYLVGAGLTPFDDGDTYWQQETAGQKNIRAYALHRISKVKTTTEPFQKVENFSLKAFADSGITNWKIDFQDINVHLIAKDATAKILKNAQLENLRITELEDDKTEFEFTTPFTYQLIRWCIAHGHHIHVKGPDALLERIGQQIRDPRLPL